VYPTPHPAPRHHSGHTDTPGNRPRYAARPASPQTLNPKNSEPLYPKPYTINELYAVNPKFQILNPNSKSLNPSSQTLDPKANILNPKALNLKTQNLKRTVYICHVTQAEQTPACTRREKTVRRIVLFGDSITEQSFGDGGFGAALQHEYRRHTDVVLRGYSGYNTAHAVALLPFVFPLDDATPPILVKPQTLNPTPQTPNLKPYTIPSYPKLQTPNL